MGTIEQQLAKDQKIVLDHLLLMVLVLVGAEVP
jgi:hypothetical protein